MDGELAALWLLWLDLFPIACAADRGDCRQCTKQAPGFAEVLLGSCHADRVVPLDDVAILANQVKHQAVKKVAAQESGSWQALVGLEFEQDALYKLMTILYLSTIAILCVSTFSSMTTTYALLWVRDYAMGEENCKMRMDGVGKILKWIGALCYMVLGFMKETILTIVLQDIRVVGCEAMAEYDICGRTCVVKIVA